MARKRQAITIKHVAAAAGVSLQTVSRVINKDGNVRPEMIARVQQAIDRLGYVPSLAARRMGGSRSYVILSLNDRERTIADWQARQGADWVDQMMLGGMLTCAAHGYRMIVELVDTHSDHIARELSAAIAALRPDGVILTPPHSQNMAIVRLLDDRGIRIARIGSLSAGPGYRLTMDDSRAARLATRHLLDLGHRRIGMIAGSPEYELSQWRVDGWRAAMDGEGLPTAGLLAAGDFSYGSGFTGASALLGAADPPTAIIACNDQMALATLAVARDRGLAVPADLSVISFDDSPVVRFTQPQLTAVVQPIAAVSARAAELLIAGSAEGADSAASADDRPIVVPATLAIRGSTAPRDTA